MPEDFIIPLPDPDDIDSPEARALYKAVLGVTGASTSLDHLSEQLQEAILGDDSNLVAGYHALIKLTLSLFDEFAQEAHDIIAVKVDGHADTILDGVDWDEFPR